jgi:UDP-N-acetylglucosamine/UDP-N-acetyl-alpha-D-glucosaminouronate 4-epimerase
MTKERFAVTGGAGFIGSQVVRTLLARGTERVIVIDNLITGHERNLHEVRSHVDLEKVDVRDYDSLLKVTRGCEAIFHLAAIPSVPKSIANPVPSHDVNINGTFNVLQAAKENAVRRVVYAASSSAYGDTEVLPKVETMKPKPQSPYALQKLVGEYYSSVYSQCFGLETVSLRFFNVYGPRQDPSSQYSGVLSIFMRCILEQQSPTIYGDGEQSRDFTYVEDVAELVVKAASARGVSGKVFNAGNGNRYTLNEVWAILNRMTGSSIPATYGPRRAGDVRDSQADTAAAIRELGHAPRFSLEEGLKKTFEWYKANVFETAAVR